jgi:hypothetical protein
MIYKDLTSWLRFNNSVTEDFMQNTVTVVGTPSVASTNAKSGNALQLDGSSGCVYLDNIELGGQDFTIDFWCYLDSSSAENSRLIAIRNSTTGYMMVTLQRGSGNIIKMWYNNYEGCTQDSGTTKTYTNASNLDNLIHIAIVYQNKVGTSLSQPTFRVYINGTQRMVAGNYATGYIAQNCKIEIGGLYGGSQIMIGALDEIALHNGVRLWTDSFTPPAAAYYDSLKFGFDTRLTVRNPPMEWRYSNPGDGSLLTLSATTVADPYRNKTVTKTGFYQGSRQACFGIAATKEIWIRCDICGTQYNASNRFRIYSEDSLGVNGICTQGAASPYFAIFYNDSNSKVASLQPMNRIIYTIWMHMKSDATDGVIEYRVYNDDYNIDYYDSYRGNVNGGADFANFYIQMDGKYIIASNIIISNSPVDISEGWLANTHDTELTIVNSAPMIGRFDTDLQINAESLFYFDTSLNIIQQTKQKFDTSLEICKTIEGRFDTVINIPHKISDSDSSLQNVTIGLQEQQLTDNITFTHIGDAGIMSAVDMSFLDYVTIGRIEETSTRGILQTCKCTCDIDAILYQQMAYSVPSSDWEWTPEYEDAVDEYNATHEDEVNKVPSAPASAHITSIANVLGKNLSLQFDDFISTMDTTVSSGTNYAGLISELFGWTSRLPQRMINCYMRGDTIYVIQRGHESHTVVLDNLKMTVHTINKKIVRTTWGSDLSSETEVKPVYDRWTSPELTPFPPQEEEPSPSGGGTIGDDGLVQKTTVEHGGEVVETTYEYEELDDGKKYLYRETAVTYVNGTKIDEVVTTHDRVSYGQSQVITTDDSGVLGSVVSPSDFDDRITPYQYQGMMSGSGYQEGYVGGYDSNGHYYPYVYDADGNRYLQTGHTGNEKKLGEYRRTVSGIALIDTSFPVDGDALMQELTDAIRWLDRKTEETVSLDIYDYNHVIDFNDKIVWHGNIYYLRANTVTMNQSIKNKQTLEFVRWY